MATRGFENGQQGLEGVLTSGFWRYKQLLLDKFWLEQPFHERHWHWWRRNKKKEKKEKEKRIVCHLTTWMATNCNTAARANINHFNLGLSDSIARLVLVVAINPWQKSLQNFVAVVNMTSGNWKYIKVLDNVFLHPSLERPPPLCFELITSWILKGQQ